MARRVCYFLVAAAVMVLLTSCESRKGLAERYRTEKEFFVANRMATRILKNSAPGRRGNVQEAVSLLDSIVAGLPLEVLGDRRLYSENEARALKHIAWKASLRAAGLVALSGRPEEVVRRYGAISEMFGRDVELGAIALYLGARAQEASGKWDEATATYESIMDGFLQESWPVGSFDERMMQIPFLQARLVGASRGKTTLASVMEKGRLFFQWAAENVPDIAVYSRLSQAKTFAVQGQWRRHVSALQDILESGEPGLEDVRPLILLDMARAYREALSLPDSALSYCSVICRDYPSHSAAEQALFVEASILRERGETARARKIFQSLSGRQSAVSASAILELGSLYEAGGRWEDARAEYGSLRGFFPHSVHNYEALLRVIRHYKETGDRAAMARAADEAVEFLRTETASLPGSDAALVARGFLVDAFVLVGRTTEAAEELEAIAGLYGSKASGVLALLRAARMLEETGEEEKARELLVEFEKRYGGTAVGEIVGGELF